MPRPIFIFLLFLGGSLPAQAQSPLFSFGSDMGLYRNFAEGQHFNSIQHTLHLDFHLVQKDGIRVSFSHGSAGKFSNAVTALAKTGSTQPQQINYTNKASLKMRRLSVAWKRYLLGRPDLEKGGNLYGTAGFGLLLGRITNSHDRLTDSSLYQLPVLAGEGKFKRLSFDLSLGGEIPAGPDFYIFTEARVFIPSSDYPSPYLYKNKNAPFGGLLCFGLRILF